MDLQHGKNYYCVSTTNGLNPNLCCAYARVHIVHMHACTSCICTMCTRAHPNVHACTPCICTRAYARCARVHMHACICTRVKLVKFLRAEFSHPAPTLQTKGPNVVPFLWGGMGRVVVALDPLTRLDEQSGPTYWVWLLLY